MVLIPHNHLSCVLRIHHKVVSCSTFRGLVCPTSVCHRPGAAVEECEIRKSRFMAWVVMITIGSLFSVSFAVLPAVGGFVNFLAGSLNPVTRLCLMDCW